MTICCTGKGSVIDRALSASTTDREVPRSANVVMGVLLIWTASGRSRCPEVSVHVRKRVLSGGGLAMPDHPTVADRPVQLAAGVKSE
jgi:hypothetical protein